MPNLERQPIHLPRRPIVLAMAAVRQEVEHGFQQGPARSLKTLGRRWMLLKAGSAAVGGLLLPRFSFSPGAAHTESFSGPTDFEKYELSDGTIHYPAPDLEFYTTPEGFGIPSNLTPAFEAWGGDQVAGRPITAPWSVDASTVRQVYLKGGLDYSLDPSGNAIGVAAADILDIVSQAGWDGWLETNYKVPAVDWNQAYSQTDGEHFKMLNNIPQIRDFVLQTDRWGERFGLPRSFSDGVLRTSKAVLRVDANGFVTVDDIGKALYEKTDPKVIPMEAKLADLTEIFWRNNPPKPDISEISDEELFANIDGSPVFKQELIKWLTDLGEIAPDIWSQIKRYVRRFREQPSGFYAASQSRTVLIQSFGPGLSLDNARLLQGSIVHEAAGPEENQGHLKLYCQGKKDNAKIGEWFAVSGTNAFLKRYAAGPLSIKAIQKNQELLDNIDDPAYQWWVDFPI